MGRFEIQIAANTEWPPSSPAGIYMLKVNNRHNRTKCEICSNLIIKTAEPREWRQLLTLSK